MPAVEPGSNRSLSSRPLANWTGLGPHLPVCPQQEPDRFRSLARAVSGGLDSARSVGALGAVLTGLIRRDPRGFLRAACPGSGRPSDSGLHDPMVTSPAVLAAIGLPSVLAI